MLEELDKAIKAVCPIHGVSTWLDDSVRHFRIDFAQEATAEQQTAAQSIADNWNWDEPHVNTAALARAYVSQVRYQKETQGILIEGQLISSDRDEIGHWYPRFASAYAYLQGDTTSNPTGLYPYKPRGGEPVVLTALQAVRAYMCLSWYVNACFGVEKVAFDTIDHLTDKQQIKAIIDAIEWPQREFMWEAPT